MNPKEKSLNYSLPLEERINAIKNENNATILDFLITRDDSFEIKINSIKRVIELMVLGVIKTDDILISALKYNGSIALHYLAAQYATNIQELNSIKSKTNDEKLIKVIDFRISDLYLLDEFFYAKNYTNEERLVVLNKFNLPSGLIEVAMICDDDVFVTNIINFITSINVKFNDYFDIFTTNDINDIIIDLAINSSKWRIRSKALIKMNDLGYPIYMEQAVLNDNDWRVRLSLLKHIKDRNGFPLLIALSDKNSDVRREATKLLIDKDDVKQVYEREFFGKNKFYAKYLLLFKNFS